MSVNVAIVGATGAVGQEFLNVLAEREFPIRSIKFLASARSAGKPVTFMGKTYAVEELTHDSFKDVKIASLAFWEAYLKNDANSKAFLASDALMTESGGKAQLLRR